MPDRVTLTDVRFVPARPGERESGFLGFVSATANDQVRLDGLVLRRTESGTLALSFPARRDRRGFDHAYIKPLDAGARTAIEQQILRALSLDQGVA